MKKCYLCYYSVGQYDDYRVNNVFVTNNIKSAKIWIKKFNNIAKEWKLYYSQYEEDKHSFTWIKDEYVEKYYDRWSSLRSINKANFEEIEFRN